MKLQMISIFFIWLLVSHEGITLGARIHANVSPEELVDAMDDSNEPKEKGTKAHKIMGSAMYENEFVDDNIYFIEEAEKVVMNSYSPTTTSTSSSFITPLHKDANDILQLHETLKNSFTFMNSPMLNELEELTPVSPSFLEMPTDNQRDAHYTEITSFLEKAMTKISRRHEDKNSKLENVLATTEKLEKKLNMKDYAWSAVFGLINGFFSGMASDFRENYKSPLCQDGLKHIGKETKTVTHAFKRLWHTSKSEILKSAISRTARTKIKTALKKFFRAIYRFIKAIMNYLWTCEATKPLVIFGSILLGAFALNMLLMSFSALMPLTVVIKLVGMVAGLYFAGKFFIDTTKSLYGRIKELKAGKCDNACKKSLIEHVFELIGCAVEVLLLGGVTEIVEFSKTQAGIKGLKTLKIDWHPAMADDIKILANYARSGKNNVKVALGSLDFKTKFKKKASAWEKYKATKNQQNKKPLSYPDWEMKYNNLEKARKMKAHYKNNPMDKKFNAYIKNFKSGRGKNKKIPLTRKEWNMKMINLKHIKHQSKFKKSVEASKEFAAASGSVVKSATNGVLKGGVHKVKGLQKIAKSARNFHMKSVGDAMDLNDAHAEAGDPLKGVFFNKAEKNKWTRLLKINNLRKMIGQTKRHYFKRQIWAKSVLANITLHTLWNMKSGQSEQEREDAKEEHLERKYGIVSKCMGDIDGLCFDIRTSKCTTGRNIVSNKCKGDQYIKCCPGAEIEDFNDEGTTNTGNIDGKEDEASIGA